MCQPELCTQHPVSVKRKERRGEEGRGGHSHLFIHHLFMYLFIYLNSDEASSVVNAVNVTPTSCRPPPLPQGRYSGEQ